MNYHQIHGPPENLSWEAILQKLIESEDSDNEIESDPLVII